MAFFISTAEQKKRDDNRQDLLGFQVAICTFHFKDSYEFATICAINELKEKRSGLENKTFRSKDKTKVKIASISHQIWPRMEEEF